MMQYNPSLVLNRLIISKNDSYVYDETFHLGVNIIRGENGSGKTTIVEALIYLLGGNVENKKVQFNNCDYVYGEFEFNFQKYTLKRSIEEDGKFPPVEIFEGAFEIAINSTEKWLRYPNKRTDSKRSYSQVLFEILNLPEQKLDSNITIHDVLRLLFQDQRTNSENIYASQKFNESQIKLQTVSDILFGIGDYESLEIKNELNKKERLYSEKDGEYNQIYKILGKSDIDLHKNSIINDINQKNTKIEELKNKIDTIQENKSPLSTEKSSQIEQEVFQRRVNINKINSQITTTNIEIDDYTAFLSNIIDKMNSASDSQKMASEITRQVFNICPECFQPITKTNNDICPLCKTPKNEISVSKKYLKIYNDLLYQKSEVERVIQNKKEELNKLKILYNKELQDLKVVELQFSNYINNLSYMDAEIKNLYINIGVTSNEINELYKQLKLAEQITEIKNEKEQLSKEIAELKEKLRNIYTQQEQRRGIIYKSINDYTIELLNKDLSNETKNIKEIFFDFGRDALYAKGKSSTSASTGCYLKNSFYFAMFLTSLKYDFVLYPRFIIMDNIEDSGISIERIRNFHNSIIEYSNDSNIQHQIIFTATLEKIAPELNDSKYCVGEKYKDKNDLRSLRFY